MKSRTLTSLLTTVFLVLLVAATLATRGTRASGPLYVSTDGYCGGNIPCYTNVQEALAAAVLFDEILVATGTYTDVAGTVAEITETITLQGGWNADFTTQDPNTYPTTLDAQGLGRVIEITGYISPTIDGFIITGGDATGEFTSGQGGGIYSYEANPIITNNVITDNIASVSFAFKGFGGGLCLYSASASALISGNQILSNTAATNNWGFGGGLYLLDSNATLSGNRVQDNKASTDAVWALARGGGLCVSGNATLTGNTIIGNIASTASPGDGGGLYIGESAPFTLTNNIITWNRADGSGGGILVYGSTPYPTGGALLNNTIAQNNLGTAGQGVFALGTTTLTLTNNIVVSHTYGIYAANNATVTADYTLFFGNTSGDTGVETGGSITNTNAITGSDPLFVAPLVWDYHIQRGSPAIDTGTTVPWLTTDIDADPRPLGASYDIGADEFSLINDLFLPLIKKNY